MLIFTNPKHAISGVVVGKLLPITGKVNTATFCYRLRYELGVLSGFGVKSMLDFGIYYDQKNKVYKFKGTQHASPQEAFNQIKS
jgi:hypothetical protein